MKNLFKILIPLLAIVAMFSITSFDFLEPQNEQEQQFKERAIVLSHLSDVSKVSQIVADLNYLDTTQAGLCDTCYTGYIQAITENRTLANKVSQQSFELSEASRKTQRLINSINQENERYAAILKRKQKARSILENTGLSLGQ
jgi:DNA repair ATPase RecN